MLIIDAVNIKKYFGDREILAFQELKIRSGDKIGIVGRNGAGKTTLMNILAGELLPDEGVVKKYCETAYIKQFTNERITAAARDLSEFNIRDKAGEEKMSGGEHTRLKIAGALSKNSILLLADEPTANLDIKGIGLLKSRLKKAEALVLISHDRDLLDSLCNRIIEVSDGRLTFYEGNFSFYRQQKQVLQKQQLQEYENYVHEKEHLEEAILNRKERAGKMKKAPSRMGNSEARLHKREAFQRKGKLLDAATGMKTRLEKLEVKTKPKEQPGIKLDFSLTNPPQNKIVISGDKFGFSYGKKVIFDNVGFQILNGVKYAIAGDNGAGKTTLLNEIFKCYEVRKSGREPEFNKNGARGGINIVPRAELGYFFQGLENLAPGKTVLENVMEDSVQNETTARTILARLLINGDNVYKKVEVLSGGERIKVSFAKLFVSGANVLLLDEPTNYLDMAAIEALQNILREYEGTVLFVSHDRAFVDRVAQRVLIVKDRGLIEYEGNLKACEERDNAPAKKDGGQMQKMLLQMRIAELLPKLSQAPASQKESLEQEYKELLEQMKQLQQQ